MKHKFALSLICAVLASPPAFADIIRATVTGTVAPLQFDGPAGPGYRISPVIDKAGVFGTAGADLANDPMSIVWTFNTSAAGDINAVVSINGHDRTWIGDDRQTSGGAPFSYFFLDKGNNNVNRLNFNITIGDGAAINTHVDTFRGYDPFPFDITTPFQYSFWPGDNQDNASFFGHAPQECF